jgi:hypothetical protein
MVFMSWGSFLMWPLRMLRRCTSDRNDNEPTISAKLFADAVHSGPC